jgi:hypothetical protein
MRTHKEKTPKPSPMPSKEKKQINQKLRFTNLKVTILLGLKEGFANYPSAYGGYHYLC